MIQKSVKHAFLILIIIQTCHSVEEYLFRLWEVWEPARYVSIAVSQDVVTGFVIINSSIVLLGFLSYILIVRVSATGVLFVIWFWIALETGNGIGHILMAWNAGGYFPGIYTAPFFLLVSAYLIIKLSQNNNHAAE